MAKTTNNQSTTAKQQKKIKVRNLMSKASSIYNRSATPDSRSQELLPQQSQDYKQLKSFFKTNFQFNTLPKVRIAKTQTSIGNENQENIDPSFNRTVYENAMKKKMISSHQKSASFETQLIGNRVPSVSHHKSFKIPHRVQFKSSHSSYEKGLSHKNYNTTAKTGFRDDRKLVHNSHTKWKHLFE